MAAGRGSWWPFAVPAVVAVLAVSLTFAFGGGGRKLAPLSCPQTLLTSTDRPWVPHVDHPVDTEDRLAPPRLPTRAIVCAYPGPGRGTQPARKPLAGSKKLRGRLDVLADTLAYAPRKATNLAHCQASDRRVDFGYYLLGLNYTDGVEWIDTAENPCAATPATNGSYDSAAYLSTALRDAYRTGSWPAPASRDRCGAKGAGRTGQERAMVPDGVTSADVCKRTTDAITAHRALDGTAARRLASALNSLSTKPGGAGCFAWYGTDPQLSYEIVFHYSVGTDAVVWVQPGKGCTPISNGLLESEKLAAIVPLLTQLLR